MESPTRWTWVCPSSRSWWRIASPGVLQSTGLQKVGHDWATELNWTYHIANTICNWHVSPARRGSLRPQHLSPLKFAPIYRSQCLAFTRHSVSSDCRGTSILVDIEEQRTHLSFCLKQLQNRQDKWKSSFLHQTSGSREWIPGGWPGASKVSSTIAPTLEIVFNTYKEWVSRQRQKVSPRREIWDSR